MKTQLSFLALVTLAACGGDPAITSVTITPSTIAAGGTVQMTVELDNFELGSGADQMEHGLSRSALREAHGEEGGHLHVYLDSTDVNPLVQTSSSSFPVLIPLGTAAGAHTLIVRLHAADHHIIEPEVKASAALTVQ